MDFRFAVVFPEDGRWSFPSTLDENGLAEAKKVALSQAVAQIVAWKPEVIHSHLICVKGQTTYRGLLSSLGFPLIGSSATAYALTKDKGLMRGALNDCKFLPRGLVIKRWNQYEQIKSWTSFGDFPCIVKAADLDDSIGLSLVQHEAQLEAAVDNCFNVGAGSVIVEKFINGSELRVGVVEYEANKFVMMPVLDYLMSNGEIRSFEYKLNVDSQGIPTALSAKNQSQFVDLAESSDLKRKLEEVTFTAFKMLDLHDFALFDLRVDSYGTPWLLEVGLFCSFNKNSVLNKMALKVGISPNQLLAKLARNAINRHSQENQVH